MTDPSHAVAASDLLRWAETLSAVARTGLGFTQSLYEKERFEEVLKVAADIRSAAVEEAEADAMFEEWLASVGEGVAGYVTPKVAVAAIVGNADGEILLTQRADSGVWLYPVGWADVGYSPAEIAVKEVYEETGIEVEVESLVAVFDGDLDRPQNWVKKTSFTALRDFIASVADPGEPYTPEPIGLRLSDAPADLKGLVLQRRDRTNQLLLWRDVRLWDKGALTRATVDPVAVTVESDGGGRQRVAVAEGVVTVAV